MADPDVLIVGAGLAGLTAARDLVGSGRTVRLLDKGRGPGGRLATRRIAGARLDHGAQFFTVRSGEFGALVDRWRELGVPVERWSNGFAQASDVRDGPAGVTSSGGDGHPRYVVRGGMNTLAAVLADGVPVDVATRVVAAWVRDRHWHVATTGGDGPRVYRAQALLCTPPVPQTLALLDRGDTTLPTEVAATLDTVAYDPCLAWLTVLDGAPRLPAPGGVQFAAGPVRWMADNARKPVSELHAVTVHASERWSTALLDADDADVAVALHAWLEPWLAGARVVESQVKRWRYAQPRDSLEQQALSCQVDQATVVLAGDAFGHPRVEGAARSGLAAARALTG